MSSNSNSFCPQCGNNFVQFNVLTKHIENELSHKLSDLNKFVILANENLTKFVRESVELYPIDGLMPKLDEYNKDIIIDFANIKTEPSINEPLQTSVINDCEFCKKIMQQNKDIFNNHWKGRVQKEINFNLAELTTSLEFVKSHLNSFIQNFLVVENVEETKSKYDLDFITESSTHIYYPDDNCFDQNILEPEVVLLPAADYFLKNKKRRTITNRRKKNSSALLKTTEHSNSIVKSEFLLDNNTSSHIEIKNIVNSFGCDICPRKFTNVHILNRHRETHTGENWFTCDICVQSYATKHTLKVHMRIHTNERPHLCEKCSKSFINLSKLKLHLRKHDNIKPFKCTVEGCTWAFAESGKLKSHMLKHTGERPHACPLCNRAYTKRYHVKKHIQSAHKNENADLIMASTRKPRLTNRIMLLKSSMVDELKIKPYFG